MRRAEACWDDDFGTGARKLCSALPARSYYLPSPLELDCKRTFSRCLRDHIQTEASRLHLLAQLAGETTFVSQIGLEAQRFKEAGKIFSRPCERIRKFQEKFFKRILSFNSNFLLGTVSSLVSATVQRPSGNIAQTRAQFFSP